MSFGKPKNPLLGSDKPEHEEFFIDKLEANMRGHPFVLKCGCSTNGYLRGSIVKRCVRHAGYSEFTPDPPKEKE